MGTVKRNKLDLDYQLLLQDILDHGTIKKDRTGTGTLSVFGRQIKHRMADGFPLLTTKKMPFKIIIVELLWFLRGDTNIKFLVDNGCHIWDGDAYKNYLLEDAKVLPNMSTEKMTQLGFRLSQQEFINRIKTDDEFANKWGELGPIYGKQWRDWNGIDQIAELISMLKTDPDSRRMIVNSWNVSELSAMRLPPCHYGFQMYTRELSAKERIELAGGKIQEKYPALIEHALKFCDEIGIPTRAISLMENQRSVDTLLGLPFNIASYAALLQIIATLVNMVPEELIFNLGDTHLYLNHIEQAKEQIGKPLTQTQRICILANERGETYKEYTATGNHNQWQEDLDYNKIAVKSRQPLPLPLLAINVQAWPTKLSKTGVAHVLIPEFLDLLQTEDVVSVILASFSLQGYVSHLKITAPLSN
jgi:thymidylate synthase